MKKLNIEYWKKLLETVAFSYGKIGLYELVQKEHKHFHPSGEPTPSREDSFVTRKVKEAGELLGIELIDHIVIGSNGRYVSFKEDKISPFEGSTSIA